MKVIEEKICKKLMQYIVALPERVRGETTLLETLSRSQSYGLRDSIRMTNGYLDYTLYGTVLARYDFDQHRIQIYTGKYCLVKYCPVATTSREKALLEYFTESSVSKRNNRYCINTESGVKTYPEGYIFEGVYLFGHWSLDKVYDYNGNLIL